MCVCHQQSVFQGWLFLERRSVLCVTLERSSRLLLMSRSHVIWAKVDSALLLAPPPLLFLSVLPYQTAQTLVCEMSSQNTTIFSLGRQMDLSRQHAVSWVQLALACTGGSL